MISMCPSYCFRRIWHASASNTLVLLDIFGAATAHVAHACASWEGIQGVVFVCREAAAARPSCNALPWNWTVVWGLAILSQLKIALIYTSGTAITAGGCRPRLHARSGSVRRSLKIIFPHL